MNPNTKHKITRAITVVTIVMVVLCALYIMSHHLGLVKELDFGAGAYYYADIPNFERYVNQTNYTTHIPYWVYVALFLAWGWLMYRLLVLIENKNKKQ